MSNMYEGMGAEDMPTAPYRRPGAGWSRGKRAAALLAVCAAVGGGAFAVTEAVTGSPGAASTALTSQAATTGSQAGTSASLTGQAAALRSVLTTTGIRRLARLRRLGGMYGQYTFETKTGPRTLAFERGTIASITGDDVVVRAADGTTMTWVLTGTSVVRQNGTKESGTALAAGQTVFAGGTLTSGTRDARLVVIRDGGATKTGSAKTSGTA
jgi:hypothetical protein